MNNPHVVHLSDDDSFRLFIGDPNGTPEFRIQRRCGPLHIAAINRNDDACHVEMLLRLGANINQTEDFCENTALHLATMVRNINIVNTLLNHGADYSLTNRYGCTALFHAAGSMQSEIVSISYPLQNQLPVLRLLLDHNSDVNARSHRGVTPLMYAAKGFSLDVIKALLQAGADVHCKDIRSRTCLHYLFSHPGKTKIMVELIKAGASVLQRDVYGRDPIRCILNSMEHSVDQKDEEVKELIRCASLVKYPEILNFRTNEEINNRIGQFKDECFAEVETMHSIFLSPNWTVREFALHGIGENPDNNLELYFVRLMGEHFVIFNDYLASHFSREYLVNQINYREIAIYSSSDQIYVKLPNHFKEVFCNSLTKTDIYILLNVILHLTTTSLANGGNGDN